MNLSDIRDRVFSQVDWAPTQSVDAIARVDAFINRAYYQLAIDAPFLFFQDQLLLATQADVVPQAEYTAPTDTVAVRPADPWVLARSIDITLAGYVSWDQTGLWGGRMIEVTDPNGRVHRHRIRQVFQLAIGNDNFQAVTLYRPWHNTTDSAMDYRIHTDEYSVPDDVIEINSLRLAKSNQNWPLDIIGELEAEKLSLDDAPGTVSAGLPRVAWRREHRKMVPDPTQTPTVSSVAQTNWAGPDPAGEFSYCFTYYWGIRDTEIQNYGPGGTILSSTAARREPLWESAPSPVSASITTANNSTRIRVNTPNIDQMLGFNASGRDRLNRTGIRKRIYRRRHTVDTANYTVGPLTTTDTFGAAIETPDKYFLLADQDGNDTIFDDDGTIIPDYLRPLRETHGYQTLAFYPRPDDRYEVDIRCLRRPAVLVDPEDTPRVHLDATEILLWRTLVLLYESMGNADMADRASNYYLQHLKKATDRYGDLRYPEEPMLKRPGRAQQIVETRRPWRRWYNLP